MDLCEVRYDHPNRGRADDRSAWKPLRGPLRDWPLTLCHPATLDVTDAIRMSHDTEGHLNENMHIIYRAGQRWVYLSDQRDDEVWLFRQASSDGRPGT